MTLNSFDVLLQKIKPLGRYQLLHLVYGIFAEIASPFSLFLPMFLVFFGPKSHCTLPDSLIQSAPEGMTEAQILEQVTPLSMETWPPGPDPCQIKDLSSRNWQYTPGNLSNFPSTSCVNGITYKLKDKWKGGHLISKLGLVCDKAEEPMRILTLTSVGAAVGSLFLSHAQDHFGRQPLLVFSFAWMVVWGIVLIFVPSLEWVKAVVFFLGIQQRLSFPLPTTYCQEMTDIGHQAMFYMILAVAFAVGCLILALIAWLATSWTTIVIAAVVIHGIMVVPSVFLDDTARWLITEGKLNRAKKFVNKMIRINGTDLTGADEVEIDRLMDSASKENQEVKVKSYAFWTLYINGWSLAVKISVCAFGMIAAIVSYEGLTINIENFQADPYLVFAITSLVEIPAGVLVPLANYLGRIPLCSWSYLISGIFSIGSIYVNTMNNTALLIFFVFVTKLTVTLAWNVLFLITQETFPTIVRGTAMGVCALAGVLVSIGVPAIVYQGLTDFRIPLIIFAVLSILAGILVLVLPETAALPLIDTLDEEKKRPITTGTVKENLTLSFARNRRRVQDVSTISGTTQIQF